MKTRMLLLAMVPCLLVVGCGMEAEPKEEVRTVPIDPCQPDDCGPMEAPGENPCPPHTEAVQTAECVDANGECVWEVTTVCAPIEDTTGGGEVPPPDDQPPPPPPSEAPPRPIRPG